MSYHKVMAGVLSRKPFFTVWYISCSQYSGLQPLPLQRGTAYAFFPPPIFHHILVRSSLHIFRCVACAHTQRGKLL